MSEIKPFLPINYSCHFAEFRDGEQFAQTHSLGLVISGQMELNDGQKKTVFKKGELYSSRKNHLLKFVKHPPKNGEIKTLTIYFDDDILHEFGKEYGYKADKGEISLAYIKPKNKTLRAFMQSLLDYEDILNNKGDTKLIRLKQKEALLLLLKYDPTLKDVLFDFSEPYKMDLETFMNKNFHFNVKVERFAYLTGRSLAAFKRDFQKVFGKPPRQWLQERRLQEAHYLITQKGKSVSDFYLDLGFENLSHFSFAFKKQFGYAPTELTKTR
ncbi:AraC family transcriptional regulator [Chryseobacterium sp. FH2]|uniref:helix-turn-helix domain-containing protein n=1 Tax=Chryseobacterium sp. FH2 TaxID=1674291 RepID=UPI00065AEF4F|nr:AraC family transcriptional regulator [Chryseobacterium sp. FH2]KMQ65296.1 AraC family transcriptional regulator [Chryseobacterium sp. FH2]